MPFDLVFNSSVPGSSVSSPTESLPTANGQGGAFTVIQHPSDPIAGEAVQFYVQGISGWSVTDAHVELGVAYDFGDPGSVFETGGGLSDNANYARGWAVAHTYDTPGTYTVTVVMAKAGGDSTQITRTVTVRDPDTIAWDVDLTVSNQAQFDALRNQAWGALNRITLADDAVFLVPGSANPYIGFGGASTYYVTRSGAGTNKPIVRGNGGPNDDYTAFRLNGSARGIFHGIRAEGGWDPVSLTAPNGYMNFNSWISSNTGSTASPSVSYHRCEGSGLQLFHVGLGANYHAGTMHFMATDCDVTNWHDYGLLGHFGGSISAAMAGNAIAQKPLALNLADGKTTQVGNAAEHGCLRIHNMRRVGIENNFLRSANGWSILPPDSATQPCIRLHQVGTTSEVDGSWYASISRNRAVGDANFVSYGSQSAGAPARVPGNCMVDGNVFDGGKQAYSGFVSVWGLAGLRCFNNVLVRHDLHHFNATTDFNCLHFRDGEGADTASQTGVSFTGFNSAIFLRQTTTQPATDNATTFEDDSGHPWTGTAWTQNGNLIYGPGLGNGASLPNYTLSEGDDFKLVAGSAAGIDAVSSGLIPAFDAEGNVRGATTNAGAHDTEVGSATNVAAPTIANPVIQTIASAGSPTVVGVVSLGSVSGLVDQVLFDVQWQVNGSNATDGLKEVYVDDEGENGTLTAIVGVANRGSGRVRATSNGVSI
ncbi:MAG: hypothetical protein AAGF94_08155 [Pseudomonadota bacterium]